MPTREEWVGWGWVCAARALGPAIGTQAMAALRHWIVASRRSGRVA